MHAEAPSSKTTLKTEPLLLVAEISHRVANEYSQAIASMRLAARALGPGDAGVSIDAAARRLQDYAEAHRVLQAPSSPGRADLGCYLRRLCSAVSAAHLRGRGVQLDFSSVSVTLDVARCWRVALILSELITNSVRHGLSSGPGTIRVLVEATDGIVICRVTDDGSAKARHEPGRGKGLIRGLASELNGVVAWESAAVGTTAELKFPILAEEHSCEAL